MPCRDVNPRRLTPIHMVLQIPTGCRPQPIQRPCAPCTKRREPHKKLPCVSQVCRLIAAEKSGRHQRDLIYGPYSSTAVATSNANTSKPLLPLGRGWGSQPASTPVLVLIHRAATATDRKTCSRLALSSDATIITAGESGRSLDRNTTHTMPSPVRNASI